jgi:peroxiredoxin
LALGITAAVIVVGVAIVIALSLRTLRAESTSVAASAPAASTPTDPLDRAVAAVGFHSTMAGAQVGVVENLPDGSQLLPPADTLLAVGAAAPAFSLATPTGQHISLADYQGKTVLLEFFATWCPHCQAEAQHLVRMLNGINSSQIVFIGINADGEDAASVLAFDRFFGIPYPSLLDPGARPGSFNRAGGEGPVTSSYGVYYFPTFYIVDASGHVSWRADREQPDAVILKELLRASSK